MSLQCSWLRTLCDENLHEWKIISSRLTNKYFEKLLKFTYASHLIANYILNFSCFTKKFFSQWSISLFPFSEQPPCIMSNFLWFIKHNSIEKKNHYFSLFFWQRPELCLSIIWGPWRSVKEEFGFNNFSDFKWQQLMYARPPFWKKNKETDNADNLLHLNHRLIKKHINWYWGTKFKAVILPPCIHSPVYTIISEAF